MGESRIKLPVRKKPVEHVVAQPTDHFIKQRILRLLNRLRGGEIEASAHIIILHFPILDFIQCYFDGHGKAVGRHLLVRNTGGAEGITGYHAVHFPICIVAIGLF